MNPVHLPSLRKLLFGTDRIPRDAEGAFTPVILTDSHGNEICQTSGYVTKQPPIEPDRFGRPRHPSAHRIHVACPTCSKVVPAGRLAQHHKVHESK